MARKPLLECSFLIPIRRDRILSDGRRHNLRAWDWLESELTQFGGATKAGSLDLGWYQDPDVGERVTDLSQRYTVALPRKELGRLRGLLREACAMFQQKCIYLSVAGHVEFVEGRRHESD
jgi:hypothetical protein